MRNTEERRVLKFDGAGGEHFDRMAKAGADGACIYHQASAVFELKLVRQLAN